MKLLRPFSGIIKSEWLPDLTDLNLQVTHAAKPDLVIRGQMVRYEEIWILVGSPNVHSVAELTKMGLQLSDLPIHDGTGDLLIAVETSLAAHRETQERSEQLANANEELHTVNLALSGFVTPDVRKTLGLAEDPQDDAGTRAEAVGRFIEHLQAAIEFRESFLANMSHELRTPLNAILGVTEVLQEGVYGTLTEKQLEVIQTVQDSGDHLLSLINDVLDLSKIESGETTLRVGECKLESLCNSTLRLLRQQIEGKGLELRFENLSKRESIQAEGRRIRQVLLNLLSNAAKFTNQGHVSLRIDDLSGEDFLRIRVEDTGIGVSTEDQKKLFQPFFQVDHGPSRRYQGTGLGLAISLRTVELHGGRIELESTPGKGSCFTVLLPFEAKTSGLPADGTRKTGRRPDTLMRKTKPDPDPDPAASGPPPRKTSVRVLLVDDVEDNRTYLVDFLRDRGFQVEVADNGISALQQVSEQIPDIILLDIHMPVMNGVNVLRCLRAMPETRELPVIAMSASVMGQDRDLCREIGASAFLPKPYKTKELMEEFGRLLDPDYIAQGGEGE